MDPIDSFVKLCYVHVFMCCLLFVVCCLYASCRVVDVSFFL
jgi:hypothetical protein